MAELVLSAAARSDLVEIRVHSIRHFGPDVADSYFLGFEEAFDRLAEYPLSGARRHGLGKGIRCLIHRQHRIFYHVAHETVLIVRIVHSAMDERRALRDRSRD